MTMITQPHGASGRAHGPRRPHRRHGDGLLAHSTLLEEQPAPALLRWTAVAVLAMVAAFLGWAALAPFTELVRAEGDVEASMPLQRVQHLEGGIVADLLVEDGQRVAAGAPLVRLNTRALMAEREQLVVRARALALDLERLEALLSGGVPRLDGVPGATAATIAAQVALFDGQASAEISRRSVLESQIATARADIASHTRLLTDARLRLAMLAEEQAVRRDLAQSGVSSRLQVIEVDLRHSNAESEVRELEGDLERFARTIAEIERRLLEQTAQTRAGYLAQRAAVLLEAGELNEAIEQLDDRIERATVVAPVSGVVLVAFTETVGGVITPGADIARIAPDGVRMRIRARIAPADIGVVAQGDTVRLRFPAFDFAQLPPLAGRVEAVLPGTAPDASGRPHYTAFVQLDDTAVLEAAGLGLMPGMAAQIDIVAGEKTLLDYLFRPMQYLREKLFSQR